MNRSGTVYYRVCLVYRLLQITYSNAVAVEWFESPTQRQYGRRPHSPWIPKKALEQLFNCSCFQESAGCGVRSL